MGHLINIVDVLPTTSYLATQYWDRPRNFITRRVYYEDGKVKAYNGKEWWLVCEFSQEQIKKAKALIWDSRLASAKDLKNAHIYDTASLSFAWNLGEETGMITNWCYPAVNHPIMEQLESALDELENETILKNEV